MSTEPKNLNTKDWYCIKFDAPRELNITALEFSRKMNSFLQEVENFNHSIVSGMDETYTVATYTEDLENGSIKWWLRDRLSNLDDNAIDKFVDKPVKSTFATTLKYAKKKAIEILGKSNNLSIEDKGNEIVKHVGKVIYESEAPKDILGECRIQIDKNRMLSSLGGMSKISKELSQNVKFISDYNNQEEEITISPDFYSDESIEDKLEKNITVRHLVVHKPELIEDAKKWSFTLDGKPITVDISETDIAVAASNRGEVRFGDTYKVRVEEQEYKTPTGKYRISYKIIEVLSFQRGASQDRLDL